MDFAMLPVLVNGCQILYDFYTCTTAFETFGVPCSMKPRARRATPRSVDICGLATSDDLAVNRVRCYRITASVSPIDFGAQTPAPRQSRYRLASPMTRSIGARLLPL